MRDRMLDLITMKTTRVIKCRYEMGVRRRFFFIRQDFYKDTFVSVRLFMSVLKVEYLNGSCDPASCLFSRIFGFSPG